MKYQLETLGQRKRAVELIQLARAEFGQLMPSEVKMLRGAALGESVDVAYKPGDERLERDSKKQEGSEWGIWESWGEHRVVRAEVLRWVCSSSKAQAFVDPSGVLLENALIEGELDISATAIPFPIGLICCAIPKPILAIGTGLSMLAFNGSAISIINADGMQVTGDVNFRDGFRALGEVRLLGATIGGDLDCTRGQFDCSDGNALSADGAEVKGSVNFRDGFRALGEVRLVGAKIGGNLSCSGGQFEYGDGDALSADGAEVKGSVNFRDSFRALGEVRLVGAMIGGSLSCSGGQFEYSDGDSLSADRVKVMGSVYFRDGFRALGEVRLLGATIGGNLECSGGQFEHSNGDALSADGIEVAGTVNFRDGFRALGGVRLQDSTIGGNLNCSGGQFEHSDGYALTADRVQIEGDLNFRDGFRALGMVRLVGATIGGSLTCLLNYKKVLREISGMPAQIDSGSLNLQSTVVKGIFSTIGEHPQFRYVEMTHARIGYLNDRVAWWPVRVVLTDFQYQSIHTEAIGRLGDRLRWLGRSDQVCKELGLQDGLPDPQPYKQLARVLRTQGHEEDARMVLMQFARRRAFALFKNQFLKSKTPGYHWFTRLRVRGQAVLRGMLSVFYGAVAGHGYNRWRPFAWMVGFIFFGSLIFSGNRVGDVFGVANPEPAVMQQTQARALADVGREEGEWLKEYPAFRPLAYSADAFLPLVNLHQESYWTPTDGWVKKFYLPFHILAGWVVTTLAAVSVTGLVRHEKE